MRLQRFLASCGVASRRASEDLIRAGRVSVNGVPVSVLGASIDPAADEVQVDGNPVSPGRRGVALLHKPKNVVTTLNDPQGRPSIADYLGEKLSGYVPVGRLDFESTGLVILTNDGELADRLMHPRYGWKRVYEVTVEGTVAPATLARMRRGVVLEDGEVQADARVLGTTERGSRLRVSVGIGRNRIVRRMLAHLGHPVLTLHRVQHGPLELRDIPPGRIRELTPDECERLRHTVFDRPPHPRPDADERRSGQRRSRRTPRRSSATR